MTDRNGVEIVTGAIVEITGAYFKRDNGLYFVAHSPGDPGWCGSDHSLMKISKGGKISTAKYNLAFWPLFITVSDRTKRAEAKRWNAENAAIEVKAALPNMEEVAAYFQTKVDDLIEQIIRLSWNCGEGSDIVRRHREIAKHYETVARRVQQ